MTTFCDFDNEEAVKCHGGEMWFCERHYAEFRNLAMTQGLGFETAWDELWNNSIYVGDDR